MIVIHSKNPRAKLAKFKPFPGNARIHSPQQISTLAGVIKDKGFASDILVDEAFVIIAGHGRFEAGRAAGMTEFPFIMAKGWTEQQKAEARIADNAIPAMAAWDSKLLATELGNLQELGANLEALGFTPSQLGDFGISGYQPAEVSAKANKTPPVPKNPIVKAGELWKLGDHRILCGDSTDPQQVARLVGNSKVPLLHADPPYGMGKENEGVQNDNLYRSKLDAFQLAWWSAWRPYLADNGSAYIWGQSEDLWRFWYSKLVDSERLTFRNEIVWDKETGLGMSSDTHRQYATASERCLFFMLGEQGFGNVNKDDYWEGFEPIRSHLEAEVQKVGWKQKDIQKLCGVAMYGHWFSKSQWTMIPAHHYETLAAAAEGKAFTRPYQELRRLYDGGLKDEGHLGAKREFYAMRAFFDNVHDNMNDVWHFARVTGAERHDHATPKPVEMIARCVKSSAPHGEIVLEPFAGSGSTLIAAETSGRICYTMEIDPAYVETVITRWEEFTGKTATREDGKGLAKLRKGKK